MKKRFNVKYRKNNYVGTVDSKTFDVIIDTITFHGGINFCDYHQGDINLGDSDYYEFQAVVIDRVGLNKEHEQFLENE